MTTSATVYLTDSALRLAAVRVDCSVSSITPTWKAAGSHVASTDWQPASGAIDWGTVRNFVKESLSALGIDHIDTLLVLALNDRSGEQELPRHGPTSLSLAAAGEHLHGLATEILTIDAGPNLISAWTACASGALSASEEGGTIASITCDSSARVAICFRGKVIDTALLDIDDNILRFDSQLQVTAVSEAGETFLDATNKNVTVGKTAERSMLELIGNLLAEVIVQLVHRKHPPQIAQRLLSTQSLRHDYTVTDYWLSGRAAALAMNLPDDLFAEGTMAPLVAAGLLGSFHERQIHPTIVSYAGEPLPDGFCVTRVSLQWSGDSALLEQWLEPGSPQWLAKDLPVMVLGAPEPTTPHTLQYIGYRFDEWMQRAGTNTESPIVVSLTSDTPWGSAADLSRVVNVLQLKRIIFLVDGEQLAGEIKRLLPDAQVLVCGETCGFLESDYVTIDSPTAQSPVVSCRIKRLVFIR